MFQMPPEGVYPVLFERATAIGAIQAGFSPRVSPRGRYGEAATVRPPACPTRLTPQKPASEASSRSRFRGTGRERPPLSHMAGAACGGLRAGKRQAVAERREGGRAGGILSDSSRKSVLDEPSFKWDQERDRQRHDSRNRTLICGGRRMKR